MDSVKGGYNLCSALMNLILASFVSLKHLNASILEFRELRSIHKSGTLGIINFLRCLLILFVLHKLKTELITSAL